MLRRAWFDFLAGAIEELDAIVESFEEGML